MEINYYVFVIFAKVCGNPHCLVLTFQTISYRLCRIVWNGKRMDGQILNMKVLILLNLMEGILGKLLHVLHTADGICRAACCIHGNVVSARHHPKPAYMIGMLVGDQDSINVIACQLQLVQALLNSFPADSCIYQDMGFFFLPLNTLSLNQFFH